MGPTHGTSWFAALQRHGVPPDLVVYEEEGHLFTSPTNEADMFATAAAWFRRHEQLRGGV